MPDFSIEMQKWSKGLSRVAGVDEAGRGSWSGPVVAAAVVFDKKKYKQAALIGVNDSKKLASNKRNYIYKHIVNHADVGVGVASPSEIDELNILEATLLAMRRATTNLVSSPDFALIDGDKVPSLNFGAEPVIKGDIISISIAAASIIAKVTRDKIMVELSGKYPGYGWRDNKGYGTKKHREALARYGITEHHRKSYKPIINILSRRD